MIIIGITFFVAFVAVVSVICVKRSQQLMESGKIIRRQMNFWENAEYFLTAAPYAQLRAAVMSTDFSDCGIAVTPDLNGQAQILFRCRHGWNALLRWQGSRDGQSLYMFHFPAWRRSRYGAPYGVNQMNMAETRLERIFLNLDPETRVESRRLQVKTRTSFI